MQANPEKFQVIMIGKRGYENCKSLSIGRNEIICKDSVKLLGIKTVYV